MKNLTLKFSLLFIIICSFGFVSDSKITIEQATDLIKKINLQMLSSKNFYSEIQYSIYKTHQDSVPIQSSEGFYIRSSNKLHSMMLGIETIQNDEVRLTIDTVSQSIVVSKVENKPEVFQNAIVEALKYCSSINLEYNENIGILDLNINTNSGIGFKKIRVKFNQIDWMIESLELNYFNMYIPDFEDVKSPKIIIEYTKINENRVSKSEFNIDKYITKNGNDFLLNQTYKDFNLVNTLNTKIN